MKTNTTMLTLKLFNAVLEKESGEPVFISKHGVFVESKAAWAIKTIDKYLNDLKLSGEQLNKTFHKSWEKVQSSTRIELAIEQILHYMSTYGTNFEGEVYIPNEVLNVPDVKVKLSVIKALSKEELTEKCLDVFRSGIALKEETMNEIFIVLESLDYTFTGREGVKNKEANIVIADKYKVYPSSVEEFIRYVMYKATGSTSLIKNAETIEALKQSKMDVSEMFENYGVEKLATVFNRYKVLFLALKSTKYKNAKVINKISKLSKKLHKPMVQNALNLVTQSKLTKKDVHWLENASVYALFKALASCHSRKEGQTSFVYRIRNGKSWTQEKTTNVNICEHNYKFILEFMKEKFNGEGKTIFIPKDVLYALPTSEKMFVGDIPTGTKFFGKNIAAGVYWENSWGARDIDLSGLNIDGKIGWNAGYYNRNQGVTYSGDMTDATNGAVEYLLFEKTGKENTTLVMSNIFSGRDDCEYKIVVGKGSKISRDYMMNPNKVMAEVKTSSIQKSTILGMLMEEDKKVSFTLLNFGAGHARVSGNSKVSEMATKALYEQWKNPLSLNRVLVALGYNVVKKIEEDETVDFNLDIDKINKSTFVDLFKK